MPKSLPLSLIAGIVGLIAGIVGLAALGTLRAQTPPVVSGIVTDDAGRPIAGVPVVATRAAIPPLAMPPMYSRPTDAAGRYAFDRLALGNYTFGVRIESIAAPIPADSATVMPGAGIVIDRDRRAFAQFFGPMPPREPDGSLRVLYEAAFYGGATTPTDARLISVDPARPRNDVNIVLPRKPALRVAGMVTAPLRGNAVDTAEPHQIIVRLLTSDTPTTPPRGALSDGMPIATALVDPGGRFVFPAVPAGDYVVDAHRAFPGPRVQLGTRREPIIVPADRIDGDPQGLAMARQVTLTADVDDLDLRLVGSGSASRAALQARGASGGLGAPTGARAGGEGAGRGAPLPGAPRGSTAISGTIRDADGNPLANVQVAAAPGGADTLPIGSPAITDADGAFRIAGLSPGRYVVVVPSLLRPTRGPDPISNGFPPAVSLNGERAAYVTTFYPATTDPDRAETIEVMGTERRGVDVVLQRSRVTDLIGSTGATGSTFDTVYLRPADRRLHLGGWNVQRARLSSTGGFTIPNVPDGRYTATLNSLRGWAVVELLMPDATLAGPLRLTLERHVTLSGRVTIDGIEDATGLLPPGLSVRVMQESPSVGDGFSPANVGADGTFTVNRVIPGRRYFLRVVTPPPWRQLSGTIDGADAFGTALEIGRGATSAQITIKR
ncbi:MAG TPA: carboxypeptidase-like regulatory domain-containing protein [Vicinamibacterales bacterium]|nr:carboxypeptidase-like regulatory domain-containing protein [Vicinamibacterales bacterium]